MPFPRPEVRIPAVPPTFDDMIEWLDRWSYGLVLLEEYPVSDIRAAVAAVEKVVVAHRVESDPWVGRVTSADEETARGVRVVLGDHEWFETSLEQFEWFFLVVAREDHGGHRQALGQFGRVLAEALRRHRVDERWLESRTSRLGSEPAP